MSLKFFELLFSPPLSRESLKKSVVRNFANFNAVAICRCGAPGGMKIKPLTPLLPATGKPLGDIPGWFPIRHPRPIRRRVPYRKAHKSSFSRAVVVIFERALFPLAAPGIWFADYNPESLLPTQLIAPQQAISLFVMHSYPSISIFILTTLYLIENDSRCITSRQSDSQAANGLAGRKQ
jgi:hypothetical protein